MPSMGSTWCTAHCRDFLLAAVDVCLIIGNLFLILEEQICSIVIKNIVG